MSGTPLNQAAFDQLFLDAHTHNAWQDKPVADELLHRLYDTLRMAPTSMNCSPARIVFVKSKAAKEKLMPALMEGNRAKTMAAPVTAIIGHDTRFYDNLPKLFPPIPGARDMFAGNAALADITAFRNGTLQGAYLILAARALGLDCGPMSGFDNAAIDQQFFAGTNVRSNFICNLGYGDPKGVYPRNVRLEFAEACSIA
ncbi:putative malonic semialdehyde reductase RutE [Sideroxyarcus emersonii]|uniref:Putative NADH dehydrogenase/NAD(P)H nitroreductase MIZ01_1726 n=1 Tax=Sideroxyarcus emersonii TaxID=2764705 RepID=A0AAN1XB55_9PROT|nr:malonic semialdehyde reductase [Sideroxyarcus emersonii]BCK87929.1 putative malonic semialdehyde reductase RutE [Sideroxyarcus emersonii]